MCDYGWTVYGTCGARTTPIPSQRARASLVGKTPSFTSCQVDMYDRLLIIYSRLYHTICITLSVSHNQIGLSCLFTFTCTGKHGLPTCIIV